MTHTGYKEMTMKFLPLKCSKTCYDTESGGIGELSDRNTDTHKCMQRLYHSFSDLSELAIKTQLATKYQKALSQSHTNQTHKK